VFVDIAPPDPAKAMQQRTTKAFMLQCITLAVRCAAHSAQPPGRLG
jgi:hypothetical protein